MERFCCKTKIISGTGAISELETFHAKRALLVTDSFFYENGTANRVAAATGAAEKLIFYKEVLAPTVELAAEGTAQVKAFAPDLIVALGGGGVIDCAKAMACICREKVRLIAIPTTSGSGAEVTDHTVLTHGRDVHPLSDSRLQPDAAILDSTLLDTLPKHLIAEAGFDVLCHCVESYVAQGAGTVTDILAADAFCAAYANLPASYAGNIQVRMKIHMAATIAGIALCQTGLGLCHAVAHSLGRAFHVPHGQLNAILLPAVIDINAYGAGAKYARLARIAGLGGGTETAAVENLKNALIRLRRELGLPGTLLQAGIKPCQIWREAGELVRMALEDPCCRTNPIPVEDFMIRRILEEVTGRF